MFATYPGGHDALPANWVNMYNWMRNFTNEDPDVITETPSHTPFEFTLYANYPNPFNPTTTIRYTLPEEAKVDVAIYNQLGQHVITLTEGTEFAGDHTLTINACTLSSGVYFCRIRAEGKTTYQKTQKMILLR
jgi:hypothetical protein